MCNERENGECDLLGTAEINLMDLLEFGNNLENEALDVLDEDDNSIHKCGLLFIDIIFDNRRYWNNVYRLYCH